MRVSSGSPLEAARLFATFLAAAERRRQGEPRGRDGQRAQRNDAELEADRLQAVEQPAVERVGTAQDDDVDEVLGLVLLAALDAGKERLAGRIGDREVRPALCHLEDEHDGERRAEAERREAD